MFDDQVNDGESQIVIDIGYLKEIDTSPQNIKQLSKMLGQQIETMLNNEIKKFGVDTTPPSKSKKPRTLNQQVTDSLKNVLKVDLTQQSNLSNTVGSQIRDEKFSLETFYSQMAPQTTDGAKLSDMSSSYTTTQEELTTSEGNLHQRQVFTHKQRNHQKQTATS